MFSFDSFCRFNWLVEWQSQLKQLISLVSASHWLIFYSGINDSCIVVKTFLLQWTICTIIEILFDIVTWIEIKPFYLFMDQVMLELVRYLSTVCWNAVKRVHLTDRLHLYKAKWGKLDACWQLLTLCLPEFSLEKSRSDGAPMRWDAVCFIFMEQCLPQYSM